ncbi:hypothetical protein Mycch_4078 [Mycolicibacterium chubuense NBB4]|uniref:Uncharacterized protein n=1 Tax=Mycolicibacterium chubuense (strain NBB4) TaxID=710421 RepID=I4BNE3_MYCCN|nr:hypothetical protein [Mycolicibacterium chubuense]AFM18800.1 hypothetical protein Mycch_4078 [Mycolicibacterium chubuense NBB4]
MNPAVATMMTRVLAENGPQNTGPDFGKASPFGLIVIVLLLIAVFGLVWSMNRHLRRLPKSFDREAPGPGQTAGAGAPDADPDLSTDNPATGPKREPD